MTRDAKRWSVLGAAIRDDRDRQGLTREQLAEKVRSLGGQVTARSITSLEAGTVPKKRPKPPTLEPTVAALGWGQGWTDRILEGEDPASVMRAPSQESGTASRADLLELFPAVRKFGRTALLLGVPEHLCRDLLHLADEVVGAVERSQYDLAASRPHAAGEGVPLDDAARIDEAMRRR
ncbi:hypothetical protein ACH43Y_28930 [Streptomyces rubiginosohelvolus]|uniref:hypothetical protein n=1 Tax=Streptomyces rubiginosohelvolus TaxID=67362 RepID=UPI0037B3F30B